MRMEPLQFHSRQFSRIFLKKKHKSSVKVEKPLPGVVGGDVEIIETCKGFQQPSSPGEYADFWLPSIPSNRNSECQQRNDTKKPPQNIRNFTMNHWSQGVFFPIADNKRTVFFLWWLKSPPFLWDSSRQCGPAGSAALPNLCSRWGTLLFWKSWAPTQKKPNHHFP